MLRQLLWVHMNKIFIDDSLIQKLRRSARVVDPVGMNQLHMA